jgi:hypothetical protein
MTATSNVPALTAETINTKKTKKNKKNKNKQTKTQTIITQYQSKAPHEAT